MRSIFENVKVVTSIAPITQVAGAVNGVAIDTEGFGDGVCIISVGAATGTPTTQTVAGKLQESDDGSTGWGDITGAAITAITTNSKTAEIRIDRRKRAASKRYIRAVVTPGFTGGSTPALPIAATIVLGNPTYSSAVANSTTGN